MGKRMTNILALLCGIVCAVCVFAYIQQVEATAAAARNDALARFGGDQADVLVATRTIAAGEAADASNTAARSWLVDLLPESPVADIAELDGLQANSPVLAGEVLSRARFGSTEASVAIPDGLQAVGVELGSAQAVGGTLAAGSLVDVYAAGQAGTSLVADRVLVAALSNAGSSRMSVTLAVDPQHVEGLIAATQTATLYLTLPSRRDGPESTAASSAVPEDVLDSANEGQEAAAFARDAEEGGSSGLADAGAGGKSAEKALEQEGE